MGPGTVSPLINPLLAARKLPSKAGADRGLAVYGSKAMAAASDRGHVEVVCLLLEAGADQNMDDALGSP